MAGPKLLSMNVVSVVIPARNAGETIGRQVSAVQAQLDALEDRKSEIVVADNRSSDQTCSVAAAHGARVVRADERASPGYARNTGVAGSSGDLLLFCDADDEVCEGWLSAHIQALTKFDIVVGQEAGAPSAQPLVSVHGFGPGGGGGNLSIRRQVFEAIGGFDVALQAGEDLDLCWRASAAGFVVGFCPEAEVAVVPRTTTTQALRQGFRNGRADVELYCRHGAHGMPRRSAFHVARSLLWLVRHLGDIGRMTARPRWALQLGAQTGRLVRSVQRRTIYL